MVVIRGKRKYVSDGFKDLKVAKSAAVLAETLVQGDVGHL